MGCGRERQSTGAEDELRDDRARANAVLLLRVAPVKGKGLEEKLLL